MRAAALLLEATLGLALCALTFLFVLRLFPVADLAIGHSERMMQATQMARRHLEGEMAKDFADVLARSGDESVSYATRRGVSQVLEFHYQIEVTQVGPITDRIKQVRVEVSWEFGGLTRSVHLATVRGGLW